MPYEFHEEEFGQSAVRVGGFLRPYVGEVLCELSLELGVEFRELFDGDAHVGGDRVLEGRLHAAYVANHLRVAVVGLVCHNVVYPEV